MRKLFLILTLFIGVVSCSNNTVKTCKNPVVDSFVNHVLNNELPYRVDKITLDEYQTIDIFYPSVEFSIIHDEERDSWGYSLYAQDSTTDAHLHSVKWSGPGENLRPETYKRLQNLLLKRRYSIQPKPYKPY